MDIDLLKKYKEYEELEAKTTPLRIEYNFLNEDIRKKREDVLAVENRKKSILIEQQEEWNRIEKEKETFNIYKSEQEEIINNKLKKEKETIIKLIESERIEKQLLIELQNQYNKDKTEFENYKSLETIKIKDQYEKIDNEKRIIIDKTQLLSLGKEELEAQKVQVEQVQEDTRKNIKLVQEKEIKLIKIEKDTKELSEILSATQFTIESKEKDIIEREIKLNDKETILNKKEIDLDKRLISIKDREDYLKEKEYNLEIKEADLGIEEKRLILLSKKLKNG